MNEKKKPFQYLGITFTPHRKFTQDEEKLGLKLPLANHNDTPEGWNWDDFWKSHNAVNGTKDSTDIFLVDGKERIPATNYLFYLDVE